MRSTSRDRSDSSPLIFESTAALASGLGTTPQEILTTRLEMTTKGGVILASLRTAVQQTSNLGMDLDIWVDGAPWPFTKGGGKAYYNLAGLNWVNHVAMLLSVPPGDHIFSVAANSGSGTGSASVGTADATRPTVFVVREI